MDNHMDFLMNKDYIIQIPGLSQGLSQILGHSQLLSHIQLLSLGHILSLSHSQVLSHTHILNSRDYRSDHASGTFYTYRLCFYFTRRILEVFILSQIF